MPVYLDNAATTRVCPEAAEAAMEAMTSCYGNPSSTHAMGREAAERLRKAREQVSRALGCGCGELFFTSGGTEGDNWALRCGAAYNRRQGRHILSSAAEHDAVRNALKAMEEEGWEVTFLRPDKDGAVSREAVLEALREDTCLGSLMLVNNETGAVTDLSDIVPAVREKNPKTLLHTDAVQAFLKLPFRADRLGVDLLTVSGHKIHAPKGIGGLYIRKGLNLPPLLRGGGQEEGKRPGTEPLPLIAAFGAAAEAASATLEQDLARMTALRTYALERLQTENPGLLVLGGGAPQILSISLPGWRSETLLNCLEAMDIFISKSSACKKGKRSHVLEAMGLPAPVIDGALRVSFSRFTTQEETERFCDALHSARERVRPSVRR